MLKEHFLKITSTARNRSETGAISPLNERIGS